MLFPFFQLTRPPRLKRTTSARPVSTVILSSDAASIFSFGTTTESLPAPDAPLLGDAGLPPGRSKPGGELVAPAPGGDPEGTVSWPAGPF